MPPDFLGNPNLPSFDTLMKTHPPLPGRRETRPHLLDFSLLTHEPVHSSIRGLSQTDRGVGEVVIAVQVREHLVQSRLEDFG